MFRDRSLRTRLARLFARFPIVVVTGARQVGKTTLLRHLFGDRAGYVVFDPVLDVEGARRDPDLFLANHRTPLILDEIQFAPELVPALKRRVDASGAAGQYLVTGSQQWSVMRSVAESLAGRAVFLHLEGFSLAEAAGAPDRSWLARWLDNPETFQAAGRLTLPRLLWEQVWRGFLPGVQDVPEDLVPDVLTGYVRTYIERDVRALGEVSDWHEFGRFVRIVAALTAQEVNHSHLGREIGLRGETARRWLSLLRATFQWSEVPALSSNATKRVSSRPKGHFADSGLACALMAISSPRALAGHPSSGALFETAVVAEVRKQASLMAPSPVLWHWRSHGGAEVDLVLERDGILFPLEIKATSHPSRADTSGLLAFRRAHPHARIARGLVVAPCETSYPVSENDVALPWDAA